MLSNTYLLNEQALRKQSRSFSIPILGLPKEWRIPIMVEYNLNKTIDSIEDCQHLSVAQKIEYISAYIQALKQEVFPHELQSAMLEVVDKNDAYVFTNQTAIFDLYLSLPPSDKILSFKWTQEMANGMAEFLTRAIITVADLDKYCYYVAGTVGCYLTEILNLHGQNVSAENYAYLSGRAVDFGLFLQKLNVIRDYWEDTYLFNRPFWPQEYFDKTNNRLMILNSLCYQALFIHGEKALEYLERIPEGNKEYERFIRYILYSGLEYLTILKNNEKVFSEKKVKLPKSFILTLFDKVSLLSREKFIGKCREKLARERQDYAKYELIN